MGKKACTTRLVAPGQLGLTCGLLLLAVISAVSVIYSTYQSRQLFNQVQQLQRKEWALEEDWERLLLEQSTWASHERVSKIAESRLGMITPDPATIKVVP